jgi:DNA-binding MarR family transcriptional regulator
MRNSSSIGVGQVNKLFGQAPFRSEKVARIFELLSFGKPMLARELAEVIGVPSKQILPRLKRYILKGWVVTQKVNNINIYSLSETAKKILRLQGSNFERVKEKAEKLLGRKLEEDELEILKFFFKMQGYVENSQNETIAEQVWFSLGRKISLTRVQEILTEFTLKGILFAFRLKNGVILKVRLNKNLL